MYLEDSGIGCASFRYIPPLARRAFQILGNPLDVRACKLALTPLVLNFENLMDRGSKRRVVDSVYDKPLPLKGRPEV